MVYDNTKLSAAVDLWLKSREVKLGEGYDYAGSLLDSFVSFCLPRGLMKSSPGRVAFGTQLKKRGFVTVRRAGRSYYKGIALTKERVAVGGDSSDWAKKQEELKKERAKIEADNRREVKARMTQETPKRNRDVGKDDHAP